MGVATRGGVNSSDPTPAPPERRSARRRGPTRVAWDALYGTIRWITGHVRGFTGGLALYFVLALTASAVALGLLAWLAYGVLGGMTARLDQAVLDAVRAYPAPVWDWLALAGAVLGSGTFLWIVVIASTVFLWRSRHHFSVLLLWVALFGGRLLSAELKTTFQRPRPDPAGWDVVVFGSTIEFPTSFSFPSGHATSAMVAYGTLAYLVARLESTPRQRRWTLAAAVFLILLIGVSRIYLGVHYPSDVLAGYLAGFIWATLVAAGIEVVRLLADRRPETRRDEEDLDRGLEPIREAVRTDAGG